MAEDFLRTYMEIKSLDEFIPFNKEDSKLRVVEMAVKQWQFNKFLYELVGSRWAWVDKLKWSDSQWMKYVNDRKLVTYVGYHEGSVAGYFELIKRGKEIEIAYFGLVADFIGQGLGGQMLTIAIRDAFDLGATRVWLSTCNLDHPAAIPNYAARGMKIYKTETDYFTEEASSPV
ncbi:GNAT family N-acetyltransferase [Akkermansiaceae bacterium]|nr:GNAT family N-acetyltransferase [Akkermansiaceae bacterium]